MLEVPFIKEIDTSRYPLVDEMLESIERTFCQIGSSKSRGRVFVDLFPHGNLNYHISNLLIAKYISILTGAEVVGLTWQRPMFVRFVFANSFVENIARSFGIEEIIDLGVAGAGVTKGEIESGEIAGVERDLAGRRYYGLEDRLRRRYKLADLRGDFPSEWTSQEISNSSHLASMISKLDFCGDDYFVTGHLEYDPYKLIALGCVRNGGQVYYNWALQPITIKVFSCEAEVLCNGVADSKDIFAETIEELTRRRKFDGERFAAPYLGAMGKIRPTDVGQMTRRVAHARSSARPRVAIMTQALSDAVHGYGWMMFADFAEWAEVTIDILVAAGIPVVLRDHPMQDLYDQTGFVAGLTRRFSSAPNFSHVRGDETFSPGDYSLCVTTQGTPGIEMPIYGLRTAAVGASRYSGLGFVDEPQSLAEYRELLIGDHVLGGGEHRSRTFRASLFGFLELFAFRTSSTFLRNGFNGAPADVIPEICALSNVETVFADPLFQQVSRLVAKRAKLTVNQAALDYCVV